MRLQNEHGNLRFWGWGYDISNDGQFKIRMRYFKIMRISTKNWYDLDFKCERSVISGWSCQIHCPICQKSCLEVPHKCNELSNSCFEVSKSCRIYITISIYISFYIYIYRSIYVFVSYVSIPERYWVRWIISRMQFARSSISKRESRVYSRLSVAIVGQDYFQF